MVKTTIKETTTFYGSDGATTQTIVREEVVEDDTVYSNCLCNISPVIGKGQKN